MIRLVLYLLGIAAVATGMSWLADRPGSLVINWEGYEVETSVFRAVVILALTVATSLFLWSLLRQVWTSPAMLGRYFTRRRQEKGLDALSGGLIAIGAGDRSTATRYAIQARKSLPNEPLTHLLRAQAAQLAGDRTTSRRIFEAMLSQPDTEQLGLRGLFLEAEREGEAEAARQFAERALRVNPKLGWATESLFELQCREARWDDALDTLATAKKHGHLDKFVADRRRAVLLTARAQELEETNGARALELASEAHALAGNLIPAAAIAGRQLASRGSTAKAAKIIERTWRVAPHPDLALVYAYARPGDSPRDRLERVRRLARMVQSPEAGLALANAAIEAREWQEARQALQPLIEDDLSQRVCALMARIEGEASNDAGRVREWLARAADAPPDPAWVADGVVAERWSPVSPVTGSLDAFEWKVPPERKHEPDAALTLKKLEEMASFGPRRDADGALVRSSGSADGGFRPGLRMRTPDSDRPITVEIEPVRSGDELPDAPRSAPASPSVGEAGKASA